MKNVILFIKSLFTTFFDFLINGEIKEVLKIMIFAGLLSAAIMVLLWLIIYAFVR